MADTKKPFVPRPSLAFWRPNNSGNGSGAIFECPPDINKFFLMMLPQIPGEKNGFDNNKKITVSLSSIDIGEMLSVLSGRSLGMGKVNDKGFYSGLYHESKSGVSIIGLTFDEKSSKFYLSVSKSTEGSPDKVKLQVGMSVGEAEALRLFIYNYGANLFMKPTAPSND